MADQSKTKELQSWKLELDNENKINTYPKNGPSAGALDAESPKSKNREATANKSPVANIVNKYFYLNGTTIVEHIQLS